MVPGRAAADTACSYANTRSFVSYITFLLAQGKVAVDVGFWGGLVPGNAQNGGELHAMLAAGALGFKTFLCQSGASLVSHPFPFRGQDATGVKVTHVAAVAALEALEA